MRRTSTTVDDAAPALKLSIDATALANPERTGIGRVLESLLPELRELAGPRTRIRFFAGGPILGPAAELIQSEAHWDAEMRSWPSLHAWQQLGMGSAIRRFSPSVHLAPDGLLPLGVSCPTVGIVHDLLWLRHPETCKPHIRAVFRWRFPSSLRQLSAVQYDSLFTQREVSGLFPQVNPERGRVVPLAVCTKTFHPADDEDLDAIRRFMTDHRLVSPYLLAVGNLRSHKNPGVLLGAMKQMHEGGHSPPQLAIIGAGRLGEEAGELRRSLPEDSVRTLGYLGDDALLRAYQGARVFVMPSRYEGFGLPVLEAMAAGVPVLYARAGALPEVAGEAGIGFDPENASELARQLIRIESDSELRTDLSRRGLKRAGEFSWRRTAEALWDRIERVAANTQRAASPPGRPPS